MATKNIYGFIITCGRNSTAESMKMNIKNVVNVINKPRVLGPAVFMAVGVYKTCKDYKKARPERKKRVLAKDTAILAGSAAAFGVISPFTRRFCKSGFMNKNFFKKLFEPGGSFNETKKLTYKSLKTTEYVLKECIAGTINSFFGILGAIYTNELMQKYVLNKPYFKKPVEGDGKDVSKNKNIPQSQVIKGTNRLFETIADLPSMKVFEKPMVAISGFSVANTKGYHNKFKKTTYELLANTLIPTMFVSLTSLAVKDSKWFVKYPALIAALGVGAEVGTHLADKYKDVIDEKIDEIDFKYIVV